MPATERRNSLSIVMRHFRDAGYTIEDAPAGSLYKVTTVRGQLIRCIDPRVDNSTSPELLGPAVPGGILGLAFFMEDSVRARGILAKLDRAIARVYESGFKPSTHGDLVDGEVKGCKLLKALTQKVFPGVHLSEDQILDAIRSNGIEQTTLVGKSNPIGFAVNFEPNTTIIQRREKYAADIWFIDELGLNPKQYAPKLVAIADLLLPRERRRLIISAA